MTDRNIALREKLRLWRTLFVHRWHAPQTIGERHGRPSVGLRFEHINHRESLVQYVWRYGAFRENNAGTGRQDVTDTPSKENGLQAIIKELESRAPGLLSRAVEYAVFRHGAPDLAALPDGHWRALVKLADRHPAVPAFAEKLYRLHRQMIPFYCQMRYLTRDEATAYLEEGATLPLLAPLRQGNNAGKDPIVFEGDPVDALQDAFARNIHHALCARARAELYVVTGGGGATVADEALAATLASLHEPPFPRPVRILAALKTAVSTMITAMPVFIIKNFFRDTLAGFVAGRYWQWPFTSTLKGSFHAARDLATGHDERMRDYLLQGGFYSGLVESEVNLAPGDPAAVPAARHHRARRRLRRLVYWLTRPAWLAEAGTRIYQYQTALATGATRYEAIRAARMVSSDFANIGASRKWRMYVHTVPFLNAALQGFDQIYQICRPEYRDDPKKNNWGTERRQHVRKTLRAGACLAVMALGVWLWNTSDHTRLDQYLEETDYEKASYLTLYDISGDMDLRIPVPFQIGAAFMKLPEISFDLGAGTETLAGPRFLWSLVHGNLAISWLPSVVQPFWEVMTNTNFFGAPIIPGYMANWPPVRQFFQRSTPRSMIVLGRLLGVSPLHIQTFVRAWTGHLGTLVVTGLDELTWDHDTYGEKPFPRTFGLLTGIASVQGYRYKSRTRWSEEFYAMANWADGWARGGPAGNGQRQTAAREVRRIANGAKRELRDLGKEIDRVREHRTMSRAHKEREIIAIYRERTATYQRAVPEMRRPYGLWQ